MIGQITAGQIADFLSLIIVGCFYAYACNEIYKLGYDDGKKAAK